MKPLRKVFDGAAPLFKEGGKLHLLWPLFKAMDLFFAEPERTDRAPHIRDGIDLKRFMFFVVIGLTPATLASIYFFGLQSLSIIVVSYTFGGLTEVVFSVIRKEDISEGFLVTGLLFPLTLPPTTPLWIVAVGVVFGVTFGKEIFGGTGHNPFNAAIVSRTFVYIGWPKYVAAGWVIPGDGLFGRVGEYIHGGVTDALSGPTALDMYNTLEKTGLTPEQVLETYPVHKLLFGAIPGSLGETSAILLLLGGIFIIAARVSDWRTPFSCLATVAIASAILHSVAPEKFAPWYFQLFSGGLMLGALFMATDPVSAPATFGARYAYGIWIGLITVLIRGLTPIPEGVMFAILLGNVFAPIMDETVLTLRRRKEAILARS